MTALHDLSVSGWVLFAITIAITLLFFARFATKNYDSIAGHALLVGVLVAWLLYLVTP